MDNKIEIFSKGIHNVLNDELIPREASSNSSNWITQDGRIKLAGGRQIIGSAGLVGKINALWTGYTTKGVKVLYRKNMDKLQYLKAGVWEDILTGLTDTDISCANYSSLAGAFTLFNSIDGFYLINNANPDSAVDIYNSAKNFKGYILVDKGRCLLWNREEDKTGLYGSYIDRQDSTVYTTVTNEAIGALGSTNYTGTLAFKAGGASRICFGITFSGAYATGIETFRDNYDGTLTGTNGGTGTINYATGAYNITFGAITTGAVTSTYRWQDFTNKGLADFTKSATRLAGEGFQFPQDEGGDAILSVVVGQDGSYFSMKSQSAYQLTLSDDDANATNLVYRKDIGIPFWRGVISTGKGVVFVNTSNPTKPVLTILTKNQLGDAIEPIVLTQHFEYGNYDYSDCSMDTFDRYITICCREKGQTNNNVILFVNIADKTVDVVKYEARMTAKVDSKLYVGSSISQDVYEILVGFDDENQSIQNEWIGKGEDFGSKMLKKEKRMRFAGLIDPDQLVDVLADFDNSGYSIIGTISGNADYVDYSSPQTIVYNTIGGQQVGGDDVASSYPFYCELRVKTPKFRKRNIKLIAKGIGYVDFNMMSDNNVLSFEDRLPKKFRTKRV